MPIRSNSQCDGNPAIHLTEITITIPTDRTKGLYGFMKDVYRREKRLSHISFRKQVTMGKTIKLEFKPKPGNPRKLPRIDMPGGQDKEKIAIVSPPVQLVTNEIATQTVSEPKVKRKPKPKAKLKLEQPKELEPKEESREPEKTAPIVTEKVTSLPSYTYNYESQMIDWHRLCKNKNFVSKFEKFGELRGICENASERRLNQTLFSYLEKYKTSKVIPRPCNCWKICDKIEIVNDCNCEGVVPFKSLVTMPFQMCDYDEPEPLSEEEDIPILEEGDVISSVPQAPLEDHALQSDVEETKAVKRSLSVPETIGNYFANAYMAQLPLI